MIVYSVFDVKTDQFSNPMFLLADGQAVRSFTAEVNRADKENMFYMHPEDFVLYKLGEFDTATGSFTVHAPVSMLAAKTVAVR